MAAATLVAQSLPESLQSTTIQHQEYLPYSRGHPSTDKNSRVKSSERKGTGRAFDKSSATMAHRQDQHSFPLFIEPYRIVPAGGDARGRDSLIGTVQRICESGARLPDNTSRCIIDRLRTIKLDNPAPRREPTSNNTTTPFPPRYSSLNALAPQTKGDQSAFAITSQIVRKEPSAFASTSLALSSSRVTDQGRQGSLQQRRQHVRGSQGGTHGSLTIQSPTARQASISRGRTGRPAGPMIWLPDEQVWLLVNPDVMSGQTAPSGVEYPHSAPLGARGSALRARSNSPPVCDQRVSSQMGTIVAPDGHRLTRSDSSPIRSQFLNLIRPPGPSVAPASASQTFSYRAQDWTQTTTHPGLSATDEDAAWYAEQQARASLHRDQDRFFPLLQQAMTGVDLPLSGSIGGTLGSLDPEVSPTSGMRRTSTSIEPLPQRRRRRSGSLRSRVSNIGNDDDAAVAASMHVRDLREQGPQRRRSENKLGVRDVEPTPSTGHEIIDWAGGNDEQDHEWLASLAAQGIVPEGLFTPRESVVSVSSGTVANGLVAYFVGPVPEERERKPRGGGEGEEEEEGEEEGEEEREGTIVSAGSAANGSVAGESDDAKPVGKWLEGLRTPTTTATFSPLSPDVAEETQSLAKAGGASGGRHHRRLFSVSSEGASAGVRKGSTVSPVSTRANSVVE